MFVYFRTITRVLEARAQKRGLVRGDWGSKKPAPEPYGLTPPGRMQLSFRKEHAISTNADIEALMRQINAAQDFSERIEQCDTIFVAKGGCRTQRQIDRVVLGQVTFT